MVLERMNQNLLVIALSQARSPGVMIFVPLQWALGASLKTPWYVSRPPMSGSRSRPRCWG